MSTDPALPDILGTAATRVDSVAEELTLASIAVQTAAIRALIGWSGPRSGVWGAAARTVAKELVTEAHMAHDLSSVLRRAAKSAAERIYYERLAAEAARRKAEAAAAAAAAARKK
jgi:hypothetical protein